MFADFLENNPWSRLEESDASHDIIEPWGDSSLKLRVPKSRAVEFCDTLDNVVLFPRFTGVYHRDTQTLEFIYTAVSADDPILKTTFTFRWNGTDHACRYQRASNRVLALATLFQPAGPETATEYRGLQRFAAITNPEVLAVFSAELKQVFARLAPTTFVVEQVADVDDASLVRLAKHLNFFMAYFWRESPSILIHAKLEADTPYLPGVSSALNIPSLINGTEIDPFLLDLSLAARTGTNRLRFLYYYQILEYAAFYWTEESVKIGVRRLLLNPDLLSHLDQYVPRLIETLVPTRQADDHKIRRVMETAVDPGTVWAELQSNIACFSAGTQFDGGFALDALIARDTTPTSFSAMWAPKVFEACRNIRNALVHARETRTQTVIAPTATNEEKLKPWIPVIRRIAEQVVLFQAQTEA